MSTEGLVHRYGKYLLIVSVLASCSVSVFPGTAGTAFAQVDANEAVALSLATFLRTARAVVSDNQTLINDPATGDKGFTSYIVLEASKMNYKLATGVDVDGIDPNSLQGRLLRAEMDAIAEVVDEAQVRINRKGVGFKGFLPAIFAAKVAARFRAKMGGVAEIKLTAPKDYVRNRANLPDGWEDQIIEQSFRSPGYPLGQHVAETTVKDGRQAYRLILPEYYKISCLTCHGEPKGKRDITGGKKEGGAAGTLGGSISVVIYQ